MSEEEIFCRRASLNEAAPPPVETKVLKNGDPDCFEHLPPNPKMLPADGLLDDCFADPSFAILKQTRRI